MRYERMQNWRIRTPPYGPLCLNMKHFAELSCAYSQLCKIGTRNTESNPLSFLTQRTYSLRRRCKHAHLLLQSRICNVSPVYHLLPHLRRHHVRRWRCVFAIHAPHVWCACHSCLASNRRPNRNRSNVTTAPTYPNYSSSCETASQLMFLFGGIFTKIFNKVTHTDSDVATDCIGCIDSRAPSNWNSNSERIGAVERQCIRVVYHCVGHCSRGHSEMRREKRIRLCLWKWLKFATNAKKSNVLNLLSKCRLD